MNIQIRPLHEITEQAFALLTRELGLADTVRFVNQFSSGYGDYTREREVLFEDLELSSILDEIQRARTGAAPP